MVKFLKTACLPLHLTKVGPLRLAFLLLVTLISVSSSLQAQPNIYFEIRNEALVGGTHYHFDVYMYADQTNTYHNKGQVYVMYDTTAFGEAVVFNGRVSNCPTGNSDLAPCTGLHLDLLDEVVTLPPFTGTPKYGTILNDNGNRLAATWISKFERVCPPNAITHTLVPDTATGLYHFEILMQNPALNPNLDFYFPLMVNQQFFSNPTPPMSGVDCDQPYGNGGLLPVELAYFDAIPQGLDQVKVTWLTSMERHHSHFVVEKKRGDGEFQELSWVLAQGNSEEDLSYSYTDRTPMEEFNYYRLRMVDVDGNAVYSETVEVRYAELAKRFAVYPIPASDYLFVEPLISIENDDFSYQIINPQGQILMQGLVNNSGPLKISTTSLSSGIYYIRISGKNTTSFQKQFAVK